MTKSGIERNLLITPYTVNIVYENGNEIQFCFSSNAGVSKFCQEYMENRDEIKRSLESRFRIKFVVAHDMCDLNLYRKIETRGFLIRLNGVVVEWLGKLECNGIKVTEKS